MRRVMPPIGTFETSREVRCPFAIGGKPDSKLTLRNLRD